MKKGKGKLIKMLFGKRISGVNKTELHKVNDGKSSRRSRVNQRIILDKIPLSVSSFVLSDIIDILTYF